MKKYRPHWIIDFQSDKPDCMLGLVRNTFAYDEPRPQAVYDIETDIVLYDTFCAFTDRPNTRVASCLHEKFGMEWDRELAKYEIRITQDTKYAAYDFVSSITDKRIIGHWPLPDFCSPIVCIQYEGDSSPEQKNLTHEQAIEICRHVEAMGCIPLLLDWRAKSPICSNGGIKSVAHYPIDRAAWGSSAQMNAAIISQCEAFVGIDSGPGKCASSTETPTLICWTGHHPALFHDPADNTTHLVPIDHRMNPLLQSNAAVAFWFEDNYNVMTYCDGSLTQEVNHWLEMVLR